MCIQWRCLFVTGEHQHYDQESAQPVSFSLLSRVYMFSFIEVKPYTRHMYRFELFTSYSSRTDEDSFSSKSEIAFIQFLVIQWRKSCFWSSRPLGTQKIVSKAEYLFSPILLKNVLWSFHLIKKMLRFEVLALVIESGLFHFLCTICFIPKCCSCYAKNDDGVVLASLLFPSFHALEINVRPSWRSSCGPHPLIRKTRISKTQCQSSGGRDTGLIGEVMWQVTL